jgi:hypothetical protein
MELHDAIRDFQLVPPVDPKLSEEQQMAARLGDLQGRHIGLLDNRKSNANVLLAELGRLLQERFLVEATTMHVKPIFSRPAPDDLIDELRAYDAVLTAIGD